ncbi:uncharacterized protein BN759_02712 [Bacteroides sp. CAG:702]|nr:uncharacterized protein BN759_02712 [Bacteroides sp. CAG:702]
MVAAHPVQGAFHLAVGFGHAALGMRVVFGIYLDDISVFVFLASGTFHDVRVLQAHFLSRRHAEVFLRRVLHKVFALYPEFTAELDGMDGRIRVFGIVDGLHFLYLPFGIVGQDELHRIQHRRHTGGTGVEVFAYRAFQQGEIVQRVIGGISDFVHKLMDGFGRISSPAESAQGRHTGVVPSVYQPFFHQNQEVALAQQDVTQVQLVELVLARAVVVQVLAFFHPVYKQVVQGAVGHKLQRAERVGHPFEIIALPVGEVIHRVCLPRVTRAVVRSLHHTVDNRVAEVHVRACHVNLGTEHHLAFLYLAGVHLLEQVEAFFHGAVAVRAFRSRLGRRTFLSRYLFRGLFVHIRLSFLDEADGEVPQLLEVIGRIIFISPLESQPLDVFLDRFYVFHVFLRGVGIIEAQVAYASVFLGDAEVHADGFGMSDV